MDLVSPLLAHSQADFFLDTYETPGSLFFWNLAAKEANALGGGQQLGLKIKQIDDPVIADKNIRNSTTPVVLVQFPEQTENRTLNILEQLISEHRHCAWIALLPEQWQQQERLCGLVSRAFFDYHHLPPEHDRLRIIIGHAIGMLTLHQHVEQLTTPGNELGQCIGDSPAMQQVKRGIQKVASTQRSVLIKGETGTGKELAARAIHQLSSRCDKPFEAINCAALPANLIQAELFGHEKGAFTDAHQCKIGRFEACHGGTLFLDEIGDMPLEQQVNLLRVLEQGCLRRIGGSCDLPIDVRIVTATHIDLEQAIAQGRFREDLYYRLNVLELEMPPLRKRDGDIELLARYVFQRFREPGRSGPRGFSSEALEAMRNHPWPGNVRELINKVQHAIVMSDSPMILPGDLGIERRDTKRRRITLESARNEAEIRTINDALHLHHNNVSEAARELDISRVTLYRLMDKLGISHH
ncbi:MAG: sigma 54-interacting transcriptional regulator [Pseudomonadota bacterium]